MDDVCGGVVHRGYWLTSATFESCRLRVTAPQPAILHAHNHSRLLLTVSKRRHAILHSNRVVSGRDALLWL
jgi:hypothetical protein